MDIYKPKRIRWFRVIAFLFRSLAGILHRWPIVLAVVVILSPITPHFRYEYMYKKHGNYRYKVHCTYLGVRGFISVYASGECPVIKIMDTRKFKA